MLDDIQTKTCSKCKQIKPISDFRIRRNRASGFRSCCKSCGNASQKVRYQTEAGKTAKHCYQQTKAGKESSRRAGQKYRLANPGKIAARIAIMCAIRAHQLRPARDFKCQYCGKPARSYHHHLGYDPEHWLDVIPLCKQCHTN